MNKKELNNGAVLIARDETAWLKVDKTLLSLKMDGTYIPLDFYTDSFKEKHSYTEKDIIRVYNNVENRTFNTCNSALNKYILGANPTWERPEDVLDEKEKEYLSAVIKPFRNRVINILKRGYYSSDEQYLIIRLKKEQANDNIVLPDFKANTMYKGMEADKAYTLEELEL